MVLTLVFVLACFYFMLPAYIANMTPVFVKGYKFLDSPIDGNRKWNGKPILGRNKTWRGLVFAVIAAGFVALLQFFIYPVIPDFGLINYNDFGIVLPVALLLGFGAIFGDMAESFFKRRFGIDSGKPWVPFDQLDFVFGALIFVSIVFYPGHVAAVVILIMSPILHIMVNIIGYALNLRDSRF